MYNENDKMRWIEEKTEETIVDKYRLPKIFERTEPYEEKYEKDLSCFSTEEAKQMFRELDYNSLPYAKVDLSYIRSYVDWQVGRGNVPDNINHFSNKEFPTRSLRELVGIKSIVVDRDQVLEWCAKLYNPSDCVILLGLFEGIKGNDYCEFVRLERSDINEEDQTVKLFGRGDRLKVSKRLINYMLESCNTIIYSTYGGVKSGHVLAPSNLVIKDAPNAMEIASDFRMGRRIYTRTRTLFNFLGVDRWMTASILVSSGIIDLVIKRSKETGMNWRSYVVSDTGRSDIYKRFGKRIQPFQFIAEYEDYLN